MYEDWWQEKYSKKYYDSINLIEAVKSVRDWIDKEVIESYIDLIPGRINDCISINVDKYYQYDRGGGDGDEIWWRWDFWR